jgi:predicted site-specific integrase-resolvase
MRYYAYLRVSSIVQKEDGTIENQIATLESYLKLHPEIEIVHTFKDDGISAFKDRPQFKEMMKCLMDPELRDQYIRFHNMMYPSKWECRHRWELNQICLPSVEFCRGP